MVKKVKIGIIELYGHHVFVHTLASLGLKSNMDVSLFIPQKIYNDLKPLFGSENNNLKIILKKEDENDWRFLSRVKKNIELDFDLIFINTIQGKKTLSFFFFKPNVKTIVATGRISEWFGNSFSLFDKDIRFFHHNISHFLISIMKKRYNHFIVHTPQAKDYGFSHEPNKEFTILPFSLFSENIQKKNLEGKINFLVTGSIKKRPRDHIGLLKAFESIWEKKSEDCSLTVLSYPKDKYGETVVKYMDRLKSKGYDIKYFKSWIPEKLYLEESEKADIFICPLNYKKYYSCGELTSGIVEAIRQGKPAIYPSGYLPDPALRESSLFYDKIEDITSIVLELIDDRNRVLKLASLAVKISYNYSLEKTLPAFKELTGNFVNQELNSNI